MRRGDAPPQVRPGSFVESGYQLDDKVSAHVVVRDRERQAAQRVVTEKID